MHNKLQFYLCKLCAKCHSREIFSSWACEFLNWKSSAKAKDSLFGKFAPRENNSLYGI